jgi:hypothetical protein
MLNGQFTACPRLSALRAGAQEHKCLVTAYNRFTEASSLHNAEMLRRSKCGGALLLDRVVIGALVWTNRLSLYATD